MFDKILVWLRRDLRVQDNAALHHALQSAGQVYCAFVLDPDILDPLPRADRRVEFILDALGVVDADLRRLNPAAGLIVRHGRPAELIPELAMQLGVQAVFYNHDDEPAALLRDAEVAQQLGSCAMHTYTIRTTAASPRCGLARALKSAARGGRTGHGGSCLC